MLAAAGLASRRGAEDWIRAGRVTVNGKVAQLGAAADPRVDDVRVDGERLQFGRRQYWLVNKPRGVVTTTGDPWAKRQGRETILDLVPKDPRGERLFPVGRLDVESEGLVLLTNDGELTHALLHPSLGNEREYHVTVRGRINQEAIGRLRRGLRLDDGPTAPWRVNLRRTDEDAGRSYVDVVLKEGRKHQIRRAFLTLGHPVHRLVRVRMGPLRLGKLGPGRARELSDAEVGDLLKHAGGLRKKATRSSSSSKRKSRR